MTNNEKAFEESDTVSKLPPHQRVVIAVGRTGYDKEFRDLFLNNPREALARYEIGISNDIEIELIIDEPGKLKILVPVFDDSDIEFPGDHPLLDSRYDSGI